MKDIAQELDELLRMNTRTTKGCKCLEAMLEGYRQRRYADENQDGKPDLRKTKI
jgi:hypothetical protein